MEKRWIGKGNLDERGVLRHMGYKMRGRDGGGGQKFSRKTNRVIMKVFYCMR